MDARSDEPCEEPENACELFSCSRLASCTFEIRTHKSIRDWARAKASESRMSLSRYVSLVLISLYLAEKGGRVKAEDVVSFQTAPKLSATFNLNLAIAHASARSVARADHPRPRPPTELEKALLEDDLIYKLERACDGYLRPRIQGDQVSHFNLRQTILKLLSQSQRKGIALPKELEEKVELVKSRFELETQEKEGFGA